MGLTFSECLKRTQFTTVLTLDIFLGICGDRLGMRLFSFFLAQNLEILRHINLYFLRFAALFGNS